MASKTTTKLKRSVPKSTGPVLSAKDYKLLWGRAAARCAFENCRRKLTESAGTATYGNMCHIIAESPSGPRGRSPLEPRQRNSYSNLILLCSHCHDIIDAIPSGPRNYPVEILHQIKSEHELWVEETLAPQADIASAVHTRVIDDITTSLLLDRWATFTDVAVRDMLPSRTLDDAEYLQTRLQQTIWPTSNKDLSAISKNVILSFIRFVVNFDSFSELQPGGRFLQADVSYKRIYPNPQYNYWSAREEIWSHLNYAYLCQVVVHLNDFAACVRKHVNPRYFIEEGLFLVHDSMNFRNAGTAFLPKQIAVTAAVKKWTKEFKTLEGSPDTYKLPRTRAGRQVGRRRPTGCER